MYHRLGAFSLGALALCSMLAGRASAAGFPEITREERELTSVPGHPNAPAVVLYKKATFLVVDRITGDYVPRFAVHVRRKILTEAGKKHAEITLVHGRYVRLQRLEGRTVLPDGREVPLSDESTFKRRASRTDKIFTTSIVFPAVEVGAILDYTYELRTSSSSFLHDPWYFQEEIPTLFSEIVYEIPHRMPVAAWIQNVMKNGIKHQTTDIRGGVRIHAWGENLPGISQEPYSLPWNDLASFIMLRQLLVRQTPRISKVLFQTWESTCQFFASDYEKALKKSEAARRRAGEVVAALRGAGRREQAEAVYRFVRDEIRTSERSGLFLEDGSTADSVLAAGHGGHAEKAVLLQAMLEALSIPSRLAWTAERQGGLINIDFPNPWWFDRVIVAAEIDGKRVFLEPADRRLGFGRLSSGLEGMPALLFSTQSPEIVRLPATPFEENLRRAKVELDLDDKGRLSGRGTLALGGHHAWTRTYWHGDAEATAKAWKEWLEEAFGGFEVSGVKVVEAVEEQRVEVRWTLSQREEEVLGDEAALSPSRPLGPLTQPFQLPAAQRVSSVLFDFGDRNEVEMTLRWPEGWKLEALPADTQAPGKAGSFTASFEVDEPGRRLTYRRRLDVEEREFGKEQYGAVKTLFGQAEKYDAQPVVLVRRRLAQRQVEMESGETSHPVND
jgi:transglutaminase-like putative cysteine protease